MELLDKLLPDDLKLALVALSFLSLVAAIIYRFFVGAKEVDESRRQQHDPSIAVIEQGEIADLNVFRNLIKRYDAVLEVVSTVNRNDANIRLIIDQVADLKASMARQESVRAENGQIVASCRDEVRDLQQQLKSATARQEAIRTENGDMIRESLNILRAQQQQDLIEERLNAYLKKMDRPDLRAASAKLIATRREDETG